MTIERLDLKLFAAPGAPELPALIPVFHRWIQDAVLPGLPIDVADYSHVPDGPGVMLVGHEADQGLDENEGPLGLLYRRKRELSGDDSERVRASAAALLHIAGLLEAEPALAGKLRFGRDRVRVILNDRLHFPNNVATATAVIPAIAAGLTAAFGKPARVERLANDARERLTLMASIG
jgi:hypothetical protein